MKKKDRKMKKTAIRDLKPKKVVKGGAGPINSGKSPKPAGPING